MSEPFFFAPPKPVASTRQSVLKEYECCQCGKMRLAKDMIYRGKFMEVTRDKTLFACKEHND